MVGVEFLFYPNSILCFFPSVLSSSLYVSTRPPSYFCIFKFAAVLIPTPPPPILSFLLTLNLGAVSTCVLPAVAQPSGRSPGAPVTGDEFSVGFPVQGAAGLVLVAHEKLGLGDVTEA